MSVYIPGMEMPTRGRILIVFPSGRVLEVSADETQDVFGEAKAVSVPEHGDLIDRDETVKTLAHDYAYAAADMVRDEMPTIIPADKEGEG